MFILFMPYFYSWLFFKKETIKKRKGDLMHFYFYIRGIYSQCELWKTLAQGQFFKWKRINLKTNEEEFTLVQGAFRQSVLGTYEYIFPEEALPDVLAIFGLTDKNHIGVGTTFMYRRKLGVLRKIIGCSKIPNSAFAKAKLIPPSIMLTDGNRGLSNLFLVGGVAVHPIGIKKDKFGDFLGYHQELL